MSKRFGPQARAAIAALEEKLSEATSNLAISRGMTAAARADAANQALRYTEFKRAVEDALSVCVNHTVLLEPTRIDHRGRTRDAVFVDVVPSPHSMGPGSLSEGAAFERMPLGVFVTEAYRDALQRTVHVSVQFGDGRIGYGISNEVLLTTHVDALERMVARQIVPEMVRELLKVVRQ